ncbi:MAG TPA: asparagine--tRNA ligase, partial [Parachlamydiaceae bacterium]|nr:asparagine--tRNA ligase [Parachlamydiaceae bacterium]
MRIKIKDLKQNNPAFSLKVGSEVTVKGWVRTVRNQKTFSFIEINDGSTLSNFQVIAEPNLPHYNTLANDLSTGVSVAITGILTESPGKGQDLELHAKKIEIIGKCDPEQYPLQKKRHSFEFLRTIAHLRPRTNTIGAVSRLRNTLAFATHKFFQERGFLYLNSPIITSSDCEGAGEMFRVTTLDLENLPKTENGKIDDSKDFFGRPTYLTVSGQLEGEIFASALSDVYTFGPTFRAENSNTSRHLAEFWMIEPEMAFANINDNMDNAESYLKYVLKYAMEHCQEDMHFFDKFTSSGLLERLKLIVDTPFERAT